MSTEKMNAMVLEEFNVPLVNKEISIRERKGSLKMLEN